MRSARSHSQQWQLYDQFSRRPLAEQCGVMAGVLMQKASGLLAAARVWYSQA
jgi:hypothetical protein